MNKFFIFLTIILSILNISRADTTRDKLIQLIQQNDEIVKFGQDPETIFKTAFQSGLETEDSYVAWDNLVIINAKTPISSAEEYEIIFNRQYNKNISNTQCHLEIALADSICAFYGIERDELVKIRKNKHLINKKKKEINELFENCLEKLNEKFNRDKMIEIITEKVLQKQNESSIPTIPDTVPDCPPLI